MRGSLFPLFPLLPSHGFGTSPLGAIGEIGTLSWFWHFTLRGNRGNRDPLSVFPGWSAKTMRGSLFPLFWSSMSFHLVKTWTTKIEEIGEIGTLSWFWHFTLRGNRRNRDPISFWKKPDMCADMCWHSLDIGWFMLQMWWLPWMKTCMIKNVFGIYGYWVN